MRTLVSSGLIAHDAATERCSPGTGLLELAGAVLATAEFHGATEVLETLAARTDETASLGIRAGRDVVILLQAQSMVWLQVERPGRRAIAVPTDTGDDESVRELVRRTVSELGGVDILVNNASNQVIGAGFPRLADTTDDAVWGDHNIKVLGSIRTARAVAPLLVAQR